MCVTLSVIREAELSVSTDCSVCEVISLLNSAAQPSLPTRQAGCFIALVMCRSACSCGSVCL